MMKFSLVLIAHLRPRAGFSSGLPPPAWVLIPHFEFEAKMETEENLVKPLKINKL